MNISTKYMQHIDDVRRESKIRIVDFIEDICSERQYRRYVNGTNIVTQEKFEAFCVKLGFTAIEFYNFYHHREAIEYQDILKAFNHIRLMQFDDAQIILDQYANHSFENPFLEDLYNFCNINFRYKKKDITPLHALDLFKKNIHYPKIKDKKAFNFVDVISLSQIVFIEATIKKNETIAILEEILSNPNKIYVSSHNRNVIPSIYAQVSRVFGMLGDLHKALTYSEKGIQYCIQTNELLSLPKLYYFNSLSHFKLGDKEQAFLQAKRALATCFIKQDTNELEQLKKLFHKDFDVDPTIFMHFD